MKTTLLGVGVAIVVLIVVILLVITREPEPQSAGQAQTTPVEKSAAVARCGSLPELEKQRCLQEAPQDGAPSVVTGSGTAGRAERGSGIEGVPSGGVTVTPGETQRELKR